jgi:hypothetical protein
MAACIALFDYQCIINLYASSHVSIFLPTVRTTLFKEDNKFSEKRLKQYSDMMKNK